MVRKGRRRPRGPTRPKQPLSAEEKAKRIKDLKAMSSSQMNYRERSLAIHGMICAKCAREFTWQDRHLLTVHHKDGNDKNNPPDGSNWENLCVYCHEDEHSRGLLGDYLRDDD
jgi:hypothetical protein